MKKKQIIIILGTVIMIGGVFGVGVMVGNQNNETPVSNNDVILESVDDEISAKNMNVIATLTPTLTATLTPVPTNTPTPSPIETTWVELGFMDNHSNLRLNFDKIMRHKSDGLGKSGVCYVDLDNKWTNNSALRYAFNQPNFYRDFWDKIEVIDVLAYTIQDEFADMTYDIPAGYRRLALVNAYWGIFNTPDGYFNGGDSLTRAEFLTGVYKAHNPVDNTIQGNDNLVQDKHNVFVNQMLDYSYINMFDASNYNGTMSRAEAVYTIVNMYFKDEIGKHDDAALRDAKDGGNITLDEALNGEDGSLPTDLYEALLVGKAMGIIEANTRWDEAITKAEAIELITATYSSKYVNKAEEKEFNNNTTVTENGNPAGTEIKDNQNDNNNGQSGTGNSGQGQYENQGSGNQGGQNENTGGTQSTNKVEHIGLTADGKVSVNTKALSKEIDKVMGEYGLDYKYKITIVNNYYTKTKDLDNTKIHDDILEKVIKEFKVELDAENKKQEEQQKQEDIFNNNKDHDAPDDWNGWETDNDDSEPAEGEFTIDLEANDALAGDGGELITDGKLNGMD